MVGPKMSRNRWIVVAGALAVLASVLVGITVGGDRTPHGAGDDPGATSSPAEAQPETEPGKPSAGGGGGQSGSSSSPDQDDPNGVNLPAGITLSAGQARRSAPAVDVVDGDPLTDDEIDAVYDRLPSWRDPDGLGAEFNWPDQTTPKPRGGTSIELDFPAGGDGTTPEQPASTDEPLKVLRTQPQGAVAVAPFISITFNQPMVPVGTVNSLTEIEPPATIQPETPGSWQWIGTETVRFVADRSGNGGVDRLPMATEYTVTVPAGTRSTSGATLDKAETFTFDTPPATVRQFGPQSTSLSLDQVFVAVFDQQIDPAEVLSAVTLTAAGSASPVRLATADEIAADTIAAGAVENAPEGRALAFRAEHELPADSDIRITVGEGTPSAEGPRPTTKDEVFTGRTYAALSLTKTECGWGTCQAGASIVLTFSNTLDTGAFDPESVRISPQVPGGAIVTAEGRSINVQSAAQAETAYTVTVPAGLRDIYGQGLEESVSSTVRTGPATTRLDRFADPVTILDPMADSPSISVNSVNRTEFRLRVFEVTLNDWGHYRKLFRDQRNERSTAAAVPDWPVLMDRIVRIDGARNIATRTAVDLSEAFGTSSSRHAVVLVEGTGRDTIRPDERWENAPTMTWVQSTTIGLDVVNDATRLRAWATDLRDGKPLPGITIGMLRTTGEIDENQSAVTGTDGIAELMLHQGAFAMVATDGTQTALVPATMWDHSWAKSAQKDRALWYLNDDRQTYRPGETVSVKGWVRLQGSDARGSLSRLPAGTEITYQAYDAYGTEIGSGTIPVGAVGGFDLTLTIPDGANTGDAWLQLQLQGLSDLQEPYGMHRFTIADFRTPDFEVATHLDGTDPAVVGDDLIVAADANYYAGGPLGDATVDWQIRTAAATYAPPGWDQFSFGTWTPWWPIGGSGFGSVYDGWYPATPYDYCCEPADPEATAVQTFTGTTDGDGSDYLQVQVGNLGKKYAGLPVSLTAQATVTDVNRQEIAGTADLLVHPAAYYVGLVSVGTFVRQGEPLTVQAIATDIDGTARPGLTIDLRSAKVTSTGGQGRTNEVETDQQWCQITSASEPVDCTFEPEAAGSYRITATVTDEEGRISRSQLTRWVAGPDRSLDSAVREQQLTLVPDRQEYRPGQTAQLLVQSPINTGTGLLTLTQHGIVEARTFGVQDGSAVLEIPITDADVPGLTASIEVVGTVPRTADDAAADDAAADDAAADGDDRMRPAYATGGLTLPVSTASRTLDVTATPRDRTVAPGDVTTLDVTVHGPDGKPMADSELEVIVADEAVLAVGGYQLPDPLQAFYPPANTWLPALLSRSYVMLAALPDGPNRNGGPDAATSSAASGAGESVAEETASVADTAAAPTSAAAGDASDRSAPDAPAAAITERSNFVPLAVFEPSVTTDADGRASVEIPLPDNLTRYRVMVVAVAGDDTFGTAESTITAGLPLTVRSSAPAFLNFGDTLELPVLVQNHTDRPVIADVVLQTANLTATGPGGKRIEVPADGRVEVRFPVAADRAGTARFRVAVAGTDGADGADAVTVELPVYTPATSETFATYGIVEGAQAVRQPMTTPEDVLADYGGLQVSTSSTALQNLTDAVGYLADYDYESSDGLAGQIIAIGSLGDVLQAFSAPGIPTPDDLAAMVEVDVTKLLALQNEDGGFAYWQRGDDSAPFNSIQATQALLVADEYGATVPKSRLDRAIAYLKDIDKHLPEKASRTVKDSLTAYALNVRRQAGDTDAAGAEKLVTASGTRLPLDAVAWLLPVVEDPGAIEALARIIDNAAVDNAGSVTFTNEVVDDAWTILQSDVRTDGLILDALLAVDPDNELIGKIVAGLMSAQRSGHWSNVQENAFVLLALRHYYDTFEQTTPDFVAGVWLGEQFAGEHTFSGRSTDSATVTVPTAALPTADGSESSEVTVGNDGAGTLFYRIGLQTAPADLDLDPLDRGFAVSRSYHAVDDPADVTRDADGWHIKAGARVRVELQLVSRSAQSHVALIDPLPAGLQIMNPDLATTPKDYRPPEPESDGTAGMTTIRWSPTWFDHQNLRDDRAEAMATWLQGGVYSYSYQATATTPGTFVAPPTRAEQIYAPETFGRAGTDRVVISD